jgi:protease I
MTCLEGKNILMIVANDNFRDEELFEPKKIFEGHGAKVKLTGNSVGTAHGMRGGTAQIESTLAKEVAEPYDAVIFIGGKGSTVYYDNLEAHRIAKEAEKRGKVLGAICMAPGTLAKAGLLRGRRATSFMTTGKLLRENGANFTGRLVEVDGNLITGSGPEAAQEFANAVTDMLKSAGRV